MWNALECCAAITLLFTLVMPDGMAAQDNPSQDHKPKHKKYRLVDLGTFGGPSSHVQGDGAGSRFLNNQGVVTGGADTSAPGVVHAFRWQQGTLTDLGTLPGGNVSDGPVVSERGWVGGSSENGEIDPLLGVPQIRAILWTDRQMINLGTLGGYESAAAGVNSRGQVAGFSTNTIPDPFSGFGVQTRAFLWERGVMRDLGTLGGPDIVGFCNGGLNERGQIFGTSLTNSIPNPTTGFPTAHAFLWERGEMRDLGSLGGTISCPDSLNNRGQVVGQSNLAGDQTAHPYLWDRGRMMDLDTFGGDNGQATDVNEAGEVVGEADLPGSQTHDAFLWKRGVKTDLGNLGRTSFAYAINEREQVVGASRIDDVAGNVRAFLWENGGPIVDLNDLIPSDSGFTLVFAENTNARGEIAGTGVPAGCQPQDVETCGHAFLLVPDGDCDEDNEARISATRDRITAERAAGAQYQATAKQVRESPLTPIERLRSMMRQRYHLPGQIPAPRD
jgi:probable HAF family extracellular repeat protein